MRVIHHQEAPQAIANDRMVIDEQDSHVQAFRPPTDRSPSLTKHRRGHYATWTVTILGAVMDSVDDVDCTPVPTQTHRQERSLDREFFPEASGTAGMGIAR
jgi:hypothetical protein